MLATSTVYSFLRQPACRRRVFHGTASEQLSALAQSESVDQLQPQSQDTIREIIGRTVEKIMRVYRLLPLETLETRDQEYLTYRTNRLKKRSRERSTLNQRAMSGSSLFPIAPRWLPQALLHMGNNRPNPTPIRTLW